MTREFKTGQSAKYRDAIVEFIAHGKSGTVQEIAVATACSRQTAYDVLRALRVEGIAAVHGQVKARSGSGSASLSDVWGSVGDCPAPRPAKPNVSMVAAAIAARPFFVTCWMESR